MRSEHRQVGSSRYWINLTVALIAMSLVYLAFKSGVVAGMASGRVDPSWRHRIFGIPIVLSQIYYGRPYDYVGYRTIENYLEPEGASVDVLLGKLTSIPHVEAGGLFYILADDKGVVDFVRLAFTFYGVRTRSLYYMFFTIFGISCALFVVTHLGNVGNLALLALLCLALYVTMPAFTMFTPGISILDLHAFGILTLPAVLHILVSATESRVRRMTLMTTACQAFIITLNHHIRSSSFSQTIAVVGGYPVLLYLSAGVRSSLDSERPAWRAVFAPNRLLPVAVLLLPVSLLPAYRRVMYNPGYFGGHAMASRPLYHNLLIGMGFNPFLQSRFHLGLGDLGAADAVDLFLQGKGRHRDKPHWAASGMNSTTTQLPFDWNEYEEAARDLYFTIWRQQPKQSLLTLAYYHPVDALHIAQLYLGHGSQPAPGRRTAYNPFRPAALATLIVVIMLSTVGGRPLPSVNVAVAGVMFLSAMIPLILVYAGGFIIMAEAFVSAGMLIYTALAVLISRLLVRVTGSPIGRLQAVDVV